MMHVIQHNEKVNTNLKTIFANLMKWKNFTLTLIGSEHVLTSLSKHFWQQLHHWVFWVWRNKLCTPGIRGLLSFFFPDLCQVGWRALVTILMSLQKCSIGSKSGVLLRHSRTSRVVPMLLLHCLDFVLRVIGLLQSVPSAQSEVLSPINWDFMQSKKHLQSMILPPPCFTVGVVVCRWRVMRCFLQTQYWELRPNSSILASSDQIMLFLIIWVSFRYFHEMSKQAFMCLFEERPVSGHSAIKAKSVECWCSDGCPSGSHSQLHTGSSELSQSDHLVLGHLSY